MNTKHCAPLASLALAITAFLVWWIYFKTTGTTDARWERYEVHGREVSAYLEGIRSAEIVADEPIAEKVSAEVWGDAMADMLAEIKQGHIAQGLADGILLAVGSEQ